MRGKVIYHVGVDTHSRITPAYAGKSAFLFRFPLAVMGSPPPMRGKASSSIP